MITPLDYLSAARFHGADTAAFLQSQLSADIAALEPGEAGFACYCTPKGQVIGLLLVCRRDEDYLVAGASELLPRILDRLKIFVMRSRVEFSADPDLHIAGSSAASAATETGWFQPGGLPLHYFFGEKAATGSGDSFKAGELRHQVTWLGEKTTEKFIPQMLGYDQIGAVSFSKGCYPGQEIVARTKYLGKVKRKPAVIQVDEALPVAPSDRVELCRNDDWLQGTVVDSTGTQRGPSLLFVIAPAEPEGEITGLKFQDRLYRCATI